MVNNEIAARFFFRNCCVAINVGGKILFSHSRKPTNQDVIVDRDFTLAKNPTDFICAANDFYQFLSLTSTSNTSLVKKLSAIGYILCNRLKRGGLRHKSFICVNEDDGIYANGKSLFAKALTKLSNPMFVDQSFCRCDNHFALSDVSDRTTLVIFDGMALEKNAIRRFYPLCQGEWRIARKALPELIIEPENAPYVLITTSTPVWQCLKESSARFRFIALDFSSYFGEENRISDYFGHTLFTDWDVEQWHLFDNLMIYCIREYLFAYRNLIDPFKI